MEKWEKGTGEVHINRWWWNKQRKIVGKKIWKRVNAVRKKGMKEKSTEEGTEGSVAGGGGGGGDDGVGGGGGGSGGGGGGCWKIYGLKCFVSCWDMKSLVWHTVNTKASLDTSGHQWIILFSYFLCQ